MPYQCLECLHKGKATVQGCCAACGSARVKTLDKSESPQRKEPQPVRVVMMVLLWLLLAYKAYEIMFLG